MYPPGLRLRQARESLGLTYRRVEEASYEIAAKRGRPDFILHISRLADMENRNVVPSLHKLYSLATIYHLSPLDIAGWYEAPFQQTLSDGAAFPAPKTHLHRLPAATNRCHEESLGFDRTSLLLAAADETVTTSQTQRQQAPDERLRYGYVGLSDKRMSPVLRPGSVVLVDSSLRKIEESDWTNEYDRPFYFVETRDGYRCGWFMARKSRLIMQPHPLSRCTPEVWKTPEEAEVIGKVIGVTTYLNEPWACLPPATPAAPRDLLEKAP